MTEIEQLRRQLGNVVEAHRESEERRRRLAEAIAAHNTVQAGDGGLGYHIWNPQDENHLESLTCPILIPAEWLRNLLQQAYEDGYAACANTYAEGGGAR